jgi:SWIM zinc finger
MRPKRIKLIQNRSRNLPTTVIDPVDKGDPFVVVVGSNTNPYLNRVVTVKFEANGTINARCTCQWARFGGTGCVHVIAALQKLASRKKRILSFWLSPEEARRQKQHCIKLSGFARDEDIWITSRRPA